MSMQRVLSIEKELKALSVLSPRVEAEQLVRFFGRMSHLDLWTGDKTLSPEGLRAIRTALKKRRSGHPLAYITGEAPFYGHDFSVGPGVLIPRPETERLLEETLSVIDRHYAGKSPQILDLGTGSGCLAVCLTLERPPCRMTALDASKAALSVARKNIRRFGLRRKIQVFHSRFFEQFRGKKVSWDILVSNPPYIPEKELAALPKEVHREPSIALNGGLDGLTAIQEILDKAPRFIKPGGWVLLEIGRGQARALRIWMKRRKEYVSTRFEKDLNGIDRILIAQRAHG